MRKVLLVDDQDILLRALARDFAREGIEAVTASTREEALAHATAETPELAILDLFLSPPEDGLQVMRDLKALIPDLFCIVVSAHMTVAHTVLAIRAGADDVFLKPVSARQALQRFAGTPHIPDATVPTLDQIEWEHISRVLHDYDGNITHAAEALGVFRQSLQRKILKHAPRALPTPGSTAARRSRKRRDTRAPK